jgi:hypothetical protein
MALAKLTAKRYPQVRFSHKADAQKDREGGRNPVAMTAVDLAPLTPETLPDLILDFLKSKGKALLNKETIRKHLE